MVGTAGTAHDARSSAIAAVMARVRGAWFAWRAWRRERDDLRALCALDDRTLRDLGLGRDDRMRFISQGEHLHTSNERFAARFEELAQRLGAG
jgi:uncharacterized protein YjiS (DUF1127 family)